MGEPTYPFTMWRWRVYDDVTKRRITTRYHMTEEEARARHGVDAVKMAGSEKVITGRSSDLTHLWR